MRVGNNNWKSDNFLEIIMMTEINAFDTINANINSSVSHVEHCLRYFCFGFEEWKIARFAVNKKSPFKFDLKIQIIFRMNCNVFKNREVTWRYPILCTSFVLLYARIYIDYIILPVNNSEIVTVINVSYRVLINEIALGFWVVRLISNFISNRCDLHNSSI